MVAEGKNLAQREDADEAPAPTAPPGLGRRHLQMALLFCGIAVSYAMRVNLSVCIVDMTATNSTRGFPVYEWSQSQRGLVLSSFFWGYVTMQIPSGILSQRFGPKRFLLAGVAGSSLLTLLMPLAASLGGWKLVCVLRALTGLLQGLVYPACHTMLGRWVPPVERGRAGPLVYSGFSFGTVGIMAGAGVLAASPVGWPGGFYVPGTLGLLWAAAALFLAAGTPDACTRISSEEREYIRRALGTASSGEKRYPVPWGSILTSVPVLALLASHSTQNFGHWMLLTQMPNYMKEVLHFEISKNGLTSALPYLSHFIMSSVFGYLGQLIAERRIISAVASRKVFNSIGQYGGGLGLLLLGLVPLTPTQAVTLLIIIVGFEAGLLGGYMVNHVDLSPNFSGPLLGLTNGISNLMGICAPVFVSHVVGDTRGLSAEVVSWRWGIVFISAGSIFLCGNTLFLLGGSAEVQTWNSPRIAKDPEEGEAGATLLEKKERTSAESETKTTKEDRHIS